MTVAGDEAREGGYGGGMDDVDAIYRRLAELGVTPEQAYSGVRRAALSAPVPPDVMPMINGRSFRCECGCNVFRHPEGEPLVFVCNSCSARFRGEL